MGADGPALDARAARLRGDDDPRRRHRPLHPGLSRACGRPDSRCGPSPRAADSPSAGSCRAVPPPSRAVAGAGPPRPEPVVVDVLAGLAGLGLGITIALGVARRERGSLRAPGGVATALGRLAGLVAAYAMVVVVAARGARAGRSSARSARTGSCAGTAGSGRGRCTCCCAHAVLITVGYARAAHDRRAAPVRAAAVDLPGHPRRDRRRSSLLIAAGVTSYRLARRRMAYETWWSVHLYTYLALFLSFSHQVDTGASFVGHPAARAWWTALWVGTLALVVVAARRRCRCGARCATACGSSRVRPEGPGTSRSCSRAAGSTACRSPAASSCSGASCAAGCGGRRTRTRCRPRPRGDRLRITVKDLGDHSARAGPRCGPARGWRSRGPTARSPPTPREGDRLLLVGAGVGITPIRALLQELPGDADVVVVLRASTPRGARPARRDRRRRRAAAAAACIELVGPRERVRLDAARAAPRSCPTCASRDVYVCGPDGFTRARRRRCAAPACPSAASTTSPSPSERPTCAEHRSSSPPPSPAPPAVLGFKPHEPTLPTATAAPPATPQPAADADGQPAIERQRRSRHQDRHRRRDRAPATATPRSASPSRTARSPRSRRCSCRATTRSRCRSPPPPSRSCARARWPSRARRSTPSAARPSRARATGSRCSPRSTSSATRRADGSRATLQVPQGGGFR